LGPQSSEGKKIAEYLRHPFLAVLRWYHTYLFAVAFVLIGSLSLNAQLSVFYWLFQASNEFSGAKLGSIMLGIVLAALCSCLLINSGRIVKDVWHGKDFLDFRKLVVANIKWARKQAAKANVDASGDIQAEDTSLGTQPGGEGSAQTKDDAPIQGFWGKVSFVWDVFVIQGLIIFVGLFIAPLIVALFYCKGDLLIFFSYFMSTAVFMACGVNVFSFVLEIVNAIVFFVAYFIKNRSLKRVLPIPGLTRDAGFKWDSETAVQVSFPPFSFCLF